MQHLIDDLYIRRCAQGLLAFGLMLLAVLQFCFLLLITARIQGWEWMDPPPATLTFAASVMSLPFSTELSSVPAAFAAILPVLFSVVCFRYIPPPPPPAVQEGTVSKAFNQLGRYVVTMLGIGIILGLITNMISAAGPSDVVLAVGESKVAAVRTALASILAFDLLYFTQLLGLRK